MNKKICLVLFSIIIFLMGNMSAVALAKEREFDLSIFENQKSVLEDDDPNQWRITIDDMENQGFITFSGGGYNGCSGMDIYSYELIFDYDVYLANYGTDEFRPIPRIWIEYMGGSAKYFNSIIIKLNDKNYTLDLQTADIQRYNKTTVEKLVYLCIDSSLLDEFLESSGPIKARLKGQKTDHDFVLPDDVVANIKILISNFKDAGGYDYIF